MIENQHITCPTIEEITAASKPGVSVELRASIKIKLQGCNPTDEAVRGAVKFLEDHDYNFEELYHYLGKPVIFLTNNSKNYTVFYLKRISAAAAIVMFLLGLSWLYYYKSNPNRIVRKSVFYEPGLPVFASVEGNKEFHELMSAYRMKDAKGGLNYYYDLVEKEPLNDTLNYFGGWLYFLNDQPDSAALVFERTAKFNSSAYQSKAQYLQASCLYLDGQTDEAKLIFENIAQDKSNPLYENSYRLLANKKLW